MALFPLAKFSRLRLAAFTGMFAVIGTVSLALVHAATDCAATGPCVNAGTAAASKSWAIDFQDEFNGTALDTTKWDPDRYGYDFGGDSPFNTSLEDAWFKTSNVTVSGGSANITLQNEPKAIGGKTYTYSSGMLRTGDHYGIAAGDYLEARISVPKCDGCWPAFWNITQPSEGSGSYTWPPEIDIFEFFDTLTQTSPSANWHPRAGGQSGPSVYGEPGTDYTNSYHVYGLYWSGSLMYIYLDGKEYGSVAAADPSPFYILLNLSTYAGHTPAAGSQMKIDWVRAWRPVSATPTPTPTPAVPRTADINHDGKVDIFDLSRLLSHWGTNDALTDINGSGLVDTFDLSILLSKWGTAGL
jgi:beta-glucanase (GH16 family)